MTEIDESVLLGEAVDQHDGPLDENVLLDESRKELKDEVDDLYDEAIAPTHSEESLTGSSQTVTAVVAPTAALTARPAASNEGRKYCCYVGNLLWYTTDADLMKAIASTGLARSQFADMKFFENRTNGQSKGYALLVLNSDAAVKQIMETLPTKTIHGQSPTVLGYNKTNQQKLEEVQAKSQTRPDVKKKNFDDGCLNMGTIRIGTGNQANRSASNSGRAGPPPLMMQQVRPTPLMNQQAPMLQNQQVPQMRLQINGQPVPMVNRAPMPQQGLMGTAPMGGMGQPMQQPPQMLMQQQPVRPMMQPTMPVQPMMGVNMAAPPPMPNQFQNSSRPPQLGMPVQSLMQMNTTMRPPVNGLPPVHVNPQFMGIQGPAISDAEFDDVMNRNQTVSSSAITRALTDASLGDLKGASETILTAINLIKGSKIGYDDRCRQLIFGLEHTLKGLESKGYSSRSSRSHRDRSRSRERDRKRRRRSRTRSRSYSRSPSPRRSRRY